MILILFLTIFWGLSNASPARYAPSTVTASALSLRDIERQAHGSLPNGAPPKNISSDALTTIYFIAFGESVKVAFFAELKNNITNNVPGYEMEDKKERSYFLDTLNAVHAQENLHQIFAENIISHFHGAPLGPCQFQFPVANLKEALSLISTYSHVVLGTLQDVQTRAALSGDDGVIGVSGAVIGQEGEQNGLYRHYLGDIPSALPFLTASTREFMLSIVSQMFVVPGTCPAKSQIKLASFSPLKVETTNFGPSTRSMTFSFSISSKDQAWANSSYSSTGLTFFLVYVNQQNTPLVESTRNISLQDKSTVVFDADFPYNGTTFGNGLTLAVVTNSSGPFTSASEVTSATLYGPAMIEIE